MSESINIDKTIYILGAGFSAPAGGPDQSLLLEKVFNLPEAEIKIRDCKVALRNFLVNDLHVASSDVNNISLEDIYTPIDRCLADGVSLRNKTPAELKIIQGQMEYLISLAVDNAFDSKPDEKKQYIRDFAKYLVNQAFQRSINALGANNADAAKEYDPFSIISLNWDILLDKYLYEALRERDAWKMGDYDPIGVVDYCCYISSIEKDAPRIKPGLWALGARGYNVKLLKIHGSMNWLQCPNCQRLFVGFQQKENISIHINDKNCRHCEKYDIRAKLQGSLVMPTFLKDLSNFQIKLIWQNAGVELMEAKRLVFIGYSLPHADFEFRQLLSRMVHKDAKIEVVLLKDETNADSIRRYDQDSKRYKQFFSGRTLKIRSDGVVEYVKELTSTTIR